MILLETSRSASSTSSGVAAADRPQPPSATMANFSRQFIKAGEHTWGLSHRGWPKTGILVSGWDNEDFHARIRAGDTPEYSAMAASWQEQRDWALEYPLEALRQAT